jgi:MerR family copper efflux transcriptional regulator
MIRSRASVPIAENMSAYLTTCSMDFLDWVGVILLYLQKYGYDVNAMLKNRTVGDLTLDHAPGCTFVLGATAMQIGTLAKKIDLSVDAIRFYERNALLPLAPRTQGGFRQYAESDVETLAFIRRVQGLGFKLSEIRGLLNLRGSRLQPCAPVRRRLQEKLADVQRKLDDLHRLERELRLALRSCNKELRKQPAHCPILRQKSPGIQESAK